MVEYLSGNNYNIKPVALKRACPRATPGYPAPPCPGGDYRSEPLSGSTYTSKTLVLRKNIFGNVLTGDLKFSDGAAILNGFKVLIKNNYGFDLVGKCYPTGKYQIVLDQNRYDRSILLLFEDNSFVLCEQFGNILINGLVTQNEPKDLFFSVPPRIISVTLYSTGWQSVLVSNTQTISILKAIFDSSNILWIAYWNANTQKWIVHKNGWSFAANDEIQSGQAVYLEVLQNDTKTVLLNPTYNWELRTGDNLIGIEKTKTLSQISSSINTNGEADVIEYIDPITQTHYIFMYGFTENASVQVPAGHGVWIHATQNISKPRVW